MNFIIVYLQIENCYERYGGKDLNFYVGPQVPITNKNTSKEKKTFGKAP